MSQFEQRHQQDMRDPEYAKEYQDAGIEIIKTARGYLAFAGDLAEFVAAGETPEEAARLAKRELLLSEERGARPKDLHTRTRVKYLARVAAHEFAWPESAFIAGALWCFDLLRDNDEKA